VYDSAQPVTGKYVTGLPTSGENYNIDSQKGAILGKRRFSRSSSKGIFESSIHFDPK
jgi:hypothetical protein